MSFPLRHLLPLLLIALAFPTRSSAEDPAQPILYPAPVAETEPVPHPGDSADDPAIWIHPTDPAQSLILGTDKHGGLIVYDINGKPIQTVAPNCWPNNVDVLYNVDIGLAKPVDLALASTRGQRQAGVKIWLIDPQTRKLSDITTGRSGLDGDAIPVLPRAAPYGFCTYHSTRTGKPYFIVNDKDGRVEQYELLPANGKVAARKVRTLKLPSIVEGCVCDDEFGQLYIAEENKGIWKFPAEPDGGTEGKLIAKTGENGLKADVEGLTLYHAANGEGYLIASSQGNNTFKIYTRQPPHSFLRTIDPIESKTKIGDVEDTDGIAVTNVPLGPSFPKGLFIAQDGHNGKKNQNFKLFRWEDLAAKDTAGNELLIDTTWNPRTPVKREASSK